MKRYEVELDLPYIEGNSIVTVYADNEQDAFECAIELVTCIKENDIDRIGVTTELTIPDGYCVIGNEL